MISYGPKKTMELGRKLAKKLKRGDVIALFGDLGSGKTTFTKGIGKGLGVKKPNRINSPTFVLIKEYKGRIPLYHLDLYRLDKLVDIEDIAVEEYLYGDGVTVIEWPEKMKKLLPNQHIAIKITIKGENKREILIKSKVKSEKSN